MENIAIEVLRSGQIANGKYIAKLEESFSKIVGTKFCVAVNDLTSALIIALYLVGVKANDEVAIPSFNCLQSTSAIDLLGAKPLWIDIDPNNMSMSTDDLNQKINKDVKAVITYHIAGYPSEIKSISTLCKENKIPLIEDCNNAFGSEINGQPVGTFGEISVYSLYPNRQLNGVEGGLICTSNPEKALFAKRMRRFGIDQKSFRDKNGEIDPKSDIKEIGWSASINNLNAALAFSQLPSLFERQKITRNNANAIYENFPSNKYMYPVKPINNSIPSYWVFLILSDKRNDLLIYLKKNGISSSCLHTRNDQYSAFGKYKNKLIGTEIVMEKLLAIPCGWWLNEIQIERILKVLNNFCKKS